jgi:hypothetical protein
MTGGDAIDGLGRGRSLSTVSDFKGRIKPVGFSDRALKDHHPASNGGPKTPRIQDAQNGQALLQKLFHHTLVAHIEQQVHFSCLRP